MIIVYCHDGEVRHLDITPNLEVVQALVGGLIQMVPGHNDVWCNEEGLLLHLPPNQAASNRYGQRLVGQVVVAKLD